MRICINSYYIIMPSNQMRFSSFRGEVPTDYQAQILRKGTPSGLSAHSWGAPASGKRSRPRARCRRGQGARLPRNGQTGPRLVVQVHRFHVRELADPELRQLAAEARLFDTAER